MTKTVRNLVSGKQITKTRSTQTKNKPAKPTEIVRYVDTYRPRRQRVAQPPNVNESYARKLASIISDPCAPNTEVFPLMPSVRAFAASRMIGARSLTSNTNGSIAFLLQPGIPGTALTNALMYSTAAPSAAFSSAQTDAAWNDSAYFTTNCSGGTAFGMCLKATARAPDTQISGICWAGYIPFMTTANLVAGTVNSWIASGYIKRQDFALTTTEVILKLDSSMTNTVAPGSLITSNQEMTALCIAFTDFATGAGNAVFDAEAYFQGQMYPLPTVNGAANPIADFSVNGVARTPAIDWDWVTARATSMVRAGVSQLLSNMAPVASRILAGSRSVPRLN